MKGEKKWRESSEIRLYWAIKETAKASLFILINNTSITQLLHHANYYYFFLFLQNATDCTHLNMLQNNLFDYLKGLWL